LVAAEARRGPALLLAEGMAAAAAALRIVLDDLVDLILRSTLPA
jgi:hypothetical protein